jgi:hypothetical protein
MIIGVLLGDLSCLGPMREPLYMMGCLPQTVSFFVTRGAKLAQLEIIKSLASILRSLFDAWSWRSGSWTGRDRNAGNVY